MIAGRAVEGDGAEPEHFRVECGSAIADLLPACLAAAGWMARIVAGEPGLLRRRVDLEQEHALEEIQQLVLVACDATDEHCAFLPGLDFFHSRPAPHPAVGSEPRIVRTLWPVGLVACSVLPVRKFGVIVRVDGHKAAPSQLAGER
jgi:hypothetical protein